MTQAPGALPTPTMLDYERTLILAIELSNTSWVLAAQIPGLPGVKAKRSIEPTPEALMAAIEGYRARAEKAGRNAARVIAIYEAGWSGFWLVRWLAKYGIETHVIQPSSVPVDHRVRRAKSDGIDADLLLRTLLAWLRGEPRVCSMVPIPLPRPMKTPAAVCESGRNSLQSGSAWSIASAPSWRLWALAYTTHYGGIGANVSTNCGRRSGIHCPRMLVRRSPACSIV